MANTSGYVSGSVAGGTIASDDQDSKGYWTLEQCKDAFTDYLGSKREEQDEITQSRRYRHGAQWTDKQIQVLNDRKQPVVTYNRVGRKIDGIVGFVERMKQDPKAYPRTPQDQPSADLATAALRFVCDDNDWKTITPMAAEGAAVDGFSGIELDMKPTKTEGDYDVSFNIVSDGYFYDPASVSLDFEDRSYDGVTRWLTEAAAKRKYPEHADAIDEMFEQAGGNTSSELSLSTDRDNRWFSFTGKRKRMRFVELWYRHDGKVCWCVFTAMKKLDEGESPWFDENGEQISRYIMFSAAVDHDGDRYGFVRNLKGAQDEINQRRSKGLHILNTRRIHGEVGAFDDIEQTRREASRPDGVVLHNKGFEAEFEDSAKQADLAGQIKFLEDAKAEIDNYGPSQVLTGEGVDDQSGRAIALRQQAAVAELGPFVLSYRGFKIRVYRALYEAISRYWTAFRWIRVTDDQNAPQLVPINQQDPMTGQMVNSIGQLDVDIILDEGPDTINAMADFNESLRELLPAIAPMLSPPKANAIVDALFATSNLPGDIKKKISDISRAEQNQPPQPPPEIVKAQIDARIKQQTAQQDAQLEANKQQTDFALKQREQAADIQMTREKNAADIQLEREKAAAKIELEREVAAAKLEIQAYSLNQEHDHKEREMALDHQHREKEFKFEANLKRKQEGEKVNDSGDVELQTPIASALENIAKMTAETLKVAADTNKVARAPRRSKIIRGKDGRPSEAVSTVDA